MTMMTGWWRRRRRRGGERTMRSSFHLFLELLALGTSGLLGTTAKDESLKKVGERGGRGEREKHIR